MAECANRSRRPGVPLAPATGYGPRRDDADLVAEHRYQAVAGVENGPEWREACDLA